MGEEAKKYIHSLNSEEKYYQKLMEIYQRAIEKHN